MARKIIPTAQLVPKFQGIGRCNNYAMLQSIPCSSECKIVGQILLDHPLSYALTASANILAVYLQQFWKTDRKTISYQGVVDKVSAFYSKFLAQPWQTMFKKKDVIQYPRFTKLRIADLMKKECTISRDENFDALLTNKIHATDDYKETTPRAYRTPTLTAASPEGKKRKKGAGEPSSLSKSLKVTIRQKKQVTPLIPPHSDDKERDEIAKATLLSLTLHKNTLAFEAQETVAKVQEKLVEEEIEKMVEEPVSHKENPEVVADDDVTKKKDDVKDADEVKDDNVEKTNDAAEEKDNDDHTDHTLVRTYAMDISQNLCNGRRGQIHHHIKKLMTHEFFMGKIREVLDYCKNIIPEMTFARANEMIKEEMPRLINLAVHKDHEIDHINVPELISKNLPLMDQK
uniref:Uncharacterized protein n=1 Tax=Tanacetum cinerariifolium TaxID=118510 RepID=A0A6L2NTY9_TANCI|nr:hypothetical protein [Tanacetum cinerariifolium]